MEQIPSEAAEGVGDWTELLNGSSDGFFLEESPLMRVQGTGGAAGRPPLTGTKCGG